MQLPECPVGPGAHKEGHYKNPEYYCYNKYSFSEALAEMRRYHGSQPSAIPKKKHALLPPGIKCD